MALVSLPPAKRRKTARKDDEIDAKSVSVDHVASLEAAVADAISKGASLNALADLLAVAADVEAEADSVLKAVFALYRLFTLILKKGYMTIGPEEEASRKVRTWIIARLATFAEVLCGLLADEETTLRTSSLRILFSLQKQLSSCIGDSNEATSSALPLQFDVPFFKRIVHALVLCPPSARASVNAAGRKYNKPDESDGLLYSDVRDLFADTWLNAYADIRWLFLRETAVLLETKELIASHPTLPENALFILEKLSSMPSANSFATIGKGDQAGKDQKKPQFWVEELIVKPKSRNNGTQSEDEEEQNEEDKDDDWRLYFDDMKDSTASEQKKERETKGRRRRLHALSIHEQLHVPTAHRAVFTRCWLSLIPLLAPSGSFQRDNDDDDEQEQLNLITRALTVLHGGVLPYLTRPVLIMDWVGSCVDYGGNIGLLALNALFKLMVEYNLDYPQFYTRLYAFLDRDLLHLRHRARFFRLTETFLSSSHLPATLLASFVKRLSRLTLNAPPAAIVMAIPFIYNILKRHPSLMIMIHRVDLVTDGEFIDPFNADEPNPTHTGALDSSLWEIVSHRQHYHSAVATLARIFEAAFTRPAYAMEDFLDHTYATLFETEIKRKIKKEPAVAEKELAQPMVVRTKVMITEEDESSEQLLQSDLVGSLWVFG